MSDTLPVNLIRSYGAWWQRMIDVGLIGFGFAGRTFHAPVISAVEGLRLAAILQRRGPEVESAYPSARVVRTLDELLSIEAIRLVVIATPNTTHFDLARRCLLAGRDVVIDKPFTTTVEEAEELVDLADQKQRLLSVYQNRRWDGDFLTLQQLLAAGKLGRIVLFESHFDRFRPERKVDAWRERPEPGGGLLFDLGPHLIDQSIVLFGEPEAISADVRIERDGASVDDAFDVVLHYRGMRALLRAGVLVTTPTPRFVIHGTRGGFVKYGLDPQEEALKRGQIPSGESWGREAPELWGKLLLAQGDSFVTEQFPTIPGDYRGYYQNVRDAALGNAPLAVTPEQAMRVTRVLHLAHESSCQRCVLPWRP